MGPYASSYFYNLLLKKSEQNYGAKNNNDYPHIIIDSVPVPDFISDTQNLEVAKDMLLESTKKLNNYGVNIIGMTCNTAHLLYKELSESSNAKFISMIDLVVSKTIKLNLKKVGIFATPTTLKYELYKNAFRRTGIKSVDIDHDTIIDQEKIIRDVVSGKITDIQSECLTNIANNFIEEFELDGLVLACTELPLVFPKNHFNNVVDCLDVLADELLIQYYL